MEWQPIETYDALPEMMRPSLAVFRFAESKDRDGRNFLRETFQLERRYGFRVATHWMPLPPPLKG